MGKKKRRSPQQPKKEFIRINWKITAKEVRLVGDNIEVGVYDFKEAMKIAEEMKLDLIEINRSAEIPVCKIMDFGKYQYEKKKKEKEQIKKQKDNAQKVKEVQLGPHTDEHDYNFKKIHAQNFLENNNIVKAVVFFKGRQIQYKEKGVIILLKLMDDLFEYGIPDTNEPKLEGNRMIVMIRPKKK